MTAPQGVTARPIRGEADEAARPAWFDALFERSAIAICFGEGDRLTAVNDAWLALLGWTRDEFDVAPPTWRTIHPGAGATDDESAAWHALEAGTWTPAERTWLRRDGSGVPVLLSGTLYDRVRFRWVAYAFDLSRQRAAERALARSEERFALAVRGSRDGIWDWDLVRDAVFVSARAAHLLGLFEADATRPAASMFALLHPDDVAAWRGKLRAHFRDRGPFRHELRIRRGDGDWQWVRIRGEATFADDRAVRMAGTITDIHARKIAELRLQESERRLALAMRATSEGVFEFVLGEDRVWCSSRSAEILELDEIPDGGVVPLVRAVVGQSEADVARQRAALEESLATGRPLDVTVSRSTLPGQLRWLRVRAFPDRDAGSDRVRVVGSIADVTADVAARDALRASEARVWQAQKLDALGTLASGMAHDFNNLLAVVLGYAEVGLAAGPGGLAERALTEIGVAGRRARELVGRLLSFARRADAPPPADGHAASVAEAADQTRSFLAATQTPGVVLASAVAPDLPLVAVEAGALQQATLNLVLNALHAMRAGGGTLTIGADRLDAAVPFDAGSHELPAGEYVRVRVSDTGCGIPLDLLDRVVEPFFTTKPYGEGTGLGLSVVHGIVSAASGAIRITSVPDAGTTVELTLPAYRDGNGALAGVS